MQTRITDCWPLAGSTALQPETTRDAPPRVTLMDLPRGIRRRIYRYLGLLPSGPSSRSIHLSKTSAYNKRCLFESVDPVEPAPQAEHEHRLDEHTDFADREVQEFSNCHLCPPSLWCDAAGSISTIGPWYCHTGFSLRSSNGWIMRPQEVVCSRCHVGPESHCCKVPTNLFQVCRAWNQDAMQMFYSENKFKIFHMPGDGLTVMDSLRPSILQTMRRLTVRLSMSFCNFASEGLDCSLRDHHWECHPGMFCCCPTSPIYLS